MTCLATQTVTTDSTVVSSSTFAELAVVLTAAFFNALPLRSRCRR